MEVFEHIHPVRQWLASRRTEGGPTGFVPTMGALHEGHIALVRKARNENGIVSCSIFVNPIQFNNPEDLEKYPRTIERDLEMLQKAGCDLVFIPSVKEMYPEPVAEKYDFGPLELVMEGKFRPGHFNGVAVVVKKLFDIFTPDRAYFGEKDYQQLCVIKELVRKHTLPIEIVPCETVRETDGLAMSSRNARLTPEERAIAPEIYRTMIRARQSVGKYSVEETRNAAIRSLERAGFKIDYIEMASVPDLNPVDSWPENGPVRIFIACFLGKVRLIDNLEIIS